MHPERRGRREKRPANFVKLVGIFLDAAAFQQPGGLEVVRLVHTASMGRHDRFQTVGDIEIGGVIVSMAVVGDNGQRGAQWFIGQQPSPAKSSTAALGRPASSMTSARKSCACSRSGSVRATADA